jgi:peptidyl-prolyl cis-trans isomerase B (cyclophilin B)
VPSNEQRRQAAKRKLERQLARRAERAKRRRIWGAAITVGVVIAAVGLVYWLVNLGPADGEASTNTDESSTDTADTTDGACKYTKNPSEQPPKDVGTPDDPAETPSTGTVNVIFKTNQGDIPVALDRSKAPCTVQSIEHLVTSKFYDETTCHRLTAGAGLKVLQCGDPLGTGGGGPGYSIPDELDAAGALAPTQLQDGTPAVIYPRGAIAMANGGPNTGGSQFFLVYGDSTLPPNYTYFGTVDAAGLAVVDKIAAGGITPGENGAEDGTPATPVQITSAVAE